MTNPYAYDSSADDDLFGEQPEERKSQPRHTIDGSVCPTCKVVHKIAGLPSDMPKGMMEAIQNFLNSLPEEILTRTDTLLAAEVPPQARLVKDFMRFLSELDQTNHQGPLVRAVAEILDEQTNGELSRRWKVYDLERRLLTSHIALKSVNTTLEDAKSANAPTAVLTLLGLLADFLVDRIAVIAQGYRQATEKAGLHPVESLINSGTYPEKQSDLVMHTMIEATVIETDLKRETD